MIFFPSLWVKAVSTLRLFASLWFNEFSDTDLSLLPTHTQSQCSPASWVHFGWKRRATRSGKCMGRDGTRKRRLMTSQLAWENITELTIPVHESLGRELRITLLHAKIIIASWIFRSLKGFYPDLLHSKFLQFYDVVPTANDRPCVVASFAKISRKVHE